MVTQKNRILTEQLGLAGTIADPFLLLLRYNHMHLLIDLDFKESISIVGVLLCEVIFRGILI